MKHSLGIFLATLLPLSVFGGWHRAEPGWQYQFPRDHHAHSNFKTEWWYFTGNLADASGHRFGYQLTFFRQGIRPPEEREPDMSRFIVNDLKFAHFTITDLSAKKFLFEQKTSRGSFGEAGFDQGDRLAWIDDWSLIMRDDGTFELTARSKDASLRLELHSRKRPVIHGANGVSAKSSEAGHASHYYSLTRLATTGEISSRKVRGESWFDHEWATNQLGPEQIGWNWLSVQFDDGGELMLYQMRLQSGAVDPRSSGTFVRPGGESVFLPGDSYRMTPTEFWSSAKTKAKYPIGWRVEVPQEKLQFTVRAVLSNQELALTPLAYWEGAIEVDGARKGCGYLELTGYAGPLRELTR